MIVNSAFHISAILAIIVGVIILIWPRFLNVAVGLYLVIAGILSLFTF